MTSAVIKWDNETRRVLSFFVGKGLLIASDIRPNPTIKLDLEVVLRVGLEVEQRIIEVLPAAMLRFPRSFLNLSKAPEKLNLVLDCLKKGEPNGPDLAGISYGDIQRWTNYKLPDKRTTPLNERRKMKSLRLKPSTIAALKRKAKLSGKSESELVEEAITKICD